MGDTLSLKGTTVHYHVGDIHIKTAFHEEDELHWEYLSAPDGATGKNAKQTFDRIQIRDDIVMLAWREADGTQVLDVWDLGSMVLHSNNVSPDGERSSVQTELHPVDPSPSESA